MELKVGDVVEVVGPCEDWRHKAAWIGAVAVVKKFVGSVPHFEFIFRPASLNVWNHEDFCLSNPNSLRLIGNTYDKS